MIDRCRSYSIVATNSGGPGRLIGILASPQSKDYRSATFKKSTNSYVIFLKSRQCNWNPMQTNLATSIIHLTETCFGINA